MTAVPLTSGNYHHPATRRATTAVEPDIDLASDLATDREFACLVSATHLGPGGARLLRRVPGITGVIDTDDAAELHMIVTASSPRTAQRVCVERVAAVVSQAIVTVPDVADYDAGLLEYLDRHADVPGRLPDTLDDSEAVAEILDRG